jgi:hypothetical protein
MMKSMRLHQGASINIVYNKEKRNRTRESIILSRFNKTEHLSFDLVFRFLYVQCLLLEFFQAMRASRTGIIVASLSSTGAWKDYE